MRFFAIAATAALWATSAIAAPQPIEDQSHLLVARTFGGNCPQLWGNYNQCCKDRDSEWGDYNSCKKNKDYYKKKYDDCCAANPILSLVLCKAEKIWYDLWVPKCDACWNLWNAKQGECKQQYGNCQKYCPKP